jgi:hypothetical protein
LTLANLAQNRRSAQVDRDAERGDNPTVDSPIGLVSGPKTVKKTYHELNDIDY